MTFNYRPNAPGKDASLGQVEISPGKVKIGAGICTMSWGGQTIISRENIPAATFAPVGASLVFHNKFRGIEWEYQEGQCVGEKGFEEEATKTEGKGATRFVTVRSGASAVALRVDAVVGVAALPGGLTDLPPLFRDDDGPIAALGDRDRALLLVLRTTRLVPPDPAPFVAGGAA